MTDIFKGEFLPYARDDGTARCTAAACRVFGIRPEGEPAMVYRKTPFAPSTQQDRDLLINILEDAAAAGPAVPDGDGGDAPRWRSFGPGG